RCFRSPDRVKRLDVGSPTDAWGRTGSSPAHPFGSLATHLCSRTPSLAGSCQQCRVGPWLCAPVSGRVCPFEDERRYDPGRTRRLAPGGGHQKLAPPFACTNLGWVPV